MAAPAGRGRVADGEGEHLELVDAGRPGVGRPDDHAPVARHLDRQAPVVGAGAQVEEIALVRRVDDRLDARRVGIPAADGERPVGAAVAVESGQEPPLGIDEEPPRRR